MAKDLEAVALGARLRGLRGSRGQSLQDVATGTGVTVSFLSRLERGQTGVTVETLRRIAGFWQLEIVDLFDRQAGPKPHVVPAGTGPGLQVDSSRLRQRARAETLIPHAGTALQATLYRTPPNGGRPVPFAHPGEEFVYVVAGEVVYEVGGVAYELGTGDAIWHPSDTPHGWQTEGSGAVTLHINTPPAW